MRQRLLLVLTFVTMLAIVLQIAGCGLPVTHVRPYFGPTYGDGGHG